MAVSLPYPLVFTDHPPMARVLQSTTMESCTRAQSPGLGPAATTRSGKYLLVPVGDTIRLVALDDIVYFESRDKYTHAHTQAEVYLLNQALTELESRVDPGQFLRVHRRHLVNVRFIKELQKWGHRRLRLVMRVPTAGELMVSRRLVGAVINRLRTDTAAPA
jgi:DNA-binding LytR/AlgR family response regulator